MTRYDADGSQTDSRCSGDGKAAGLTLIFLRAQRVNKKLKQKSIKNDPATPHGGALGERRYSSYSFLILALEMGDWSALCREKTDDYKFNITGAKLHIY
jgi:hypothetical protein